MKKTEKEGMTPEEQQKKYEKMYVRARRGNERTNQIYKHLRKIGLSRNQAQRIRYWTKNHITQYLQANQEDKTVQHIIQQVEKQCGVRGK